MKILVGTAVVVATLFALSPQDAAFAPVDAQHQPAPIQPIKTPMPPAPATSQPPTAKPIKPAVKTLPTFKPVTSALKKSASQPPALKIAPEATPSIAKKSSIQASPVKTPAVKVTSAPVPTVKTPVVKPSTSQISTSQTPATLQSTAGQKPAPSPVSKLGNLEGYFRKVTITPPVGANLIKTIQITYSSKNGQDISQRIMVNKLVDSNKPVVVTHNPTPQIKIVSYNVVPLFKLFVADHKIFIQTADEELKDFSLRSPDRLVMDFKTKTVPKFQTVVHNIKSDFISKMVIGYHNNGQYRVVFYLTQPFKYRMTRFNDGLKVEFTQ